MALFTRRFSPSTHRPLRADRAAECAAIHAGAFHQGWSNAEIVALLTGSTAVGTAALDPASNALRGFALSRLAADEAEVLTIAVASTFRGKGVGRDLLREHLTAVTFAGAKTIFLEVDGGNAPALALYKHFGFQKVGERAGYYQTRDGKPATALVMRKDLA